MTDEAINKSFDDSNTVLHIACDRRMETVAIKLIDRMDEKEINK